jgi:hypothetical protein
MFMYTPLGNKAVANAVEALKGAIRFELVKSTEELAKAVESAFAVVERTYPEVHDTEPREYIHQQVIDFARGNFSSGAVWFSTDKYLNLF